jgi:ceramide glucosyltransferase
VAIVVYILGFAALSYQIVAMLAALFFRVECTLVKQRAQPANLPAVSILKPISGLDTGFESAILGHALQDYPEFEILFGVHALDDLAVPVIQTLIEQHPDVQIRLIPCPTKTPNGKVGILIDLLHEARYPVLVVNDSDISVPKDYLRRIVGRLVMRKAGLVTCLYRATANSIAGLWEAFGVSIDFVPSTLVAPLVGIREFGLGSTLCFRRVDLEKAGGFQAVSSYIADDYQLARRIVATSGRALMSEVVVQTNLSEPSWADVWRHQVRWARTIRVSRGDGFLGLPITHAGLWVVLALVCHLWSLALVLFLARVAMAVMGGFVALESWLALLLSPLAPLWDLWAFVVWLAAFAGRTVEWRGARYRLTKDGRLERIAD